MAFNNTFPAYGKPYARGNVVCTAIDHSKGTYMCTVHLSLIVCQLIVAL